MFIYKFLLVEVEIYFRRVLVFFYFLFIGGRRGKVDVGVLRNFVVNKCFVGSWKLDWYILNWLVWKDMG